MRRNTEICRISRLFPEAEIEQWNKDYQVETYAPGFY
jgi:hypothetical protein